MDEGITSILKKFKLLDADEYLVPPEHITIRQLVRKIASYRNVIGEGKKLSPDQYEELADMETAKDYYDEALEDELDELNVDEEEDKEEEDIEDEDIEDLDEEVQDDEFNDDDEECEEDDDEHDDEEEDEEY